MANKEKYMGVIKDTGEILEERPMTQDEQLRLGGVRMDAEQVIREQRAGAYPQY